MECISKFKDVNYNSNLFCKTCGMDIGLAPIKVNRKDNVFLYCCEDCAEIK